MRKFTLNVAAVLLPLILSVAGPAAGQSRDEEIALLRAQIAEQQKQLQELQKKLDKLAQQAVPAEPVSFNGGPSAEPASSRQPDDTPAPIAARPAPPAAAIADDGKPFSPLSFRIGGAEFTPGGFADMISVYRSTNAGGIGTGFGSIPLGNTAAGQLSEFRMSPQNSRISLRADARYGNELVTGYLEGDFLGSAPSNLYVTSNAATFRMRLYWFDVQRSKFEFLAGQSWSLLTPNRAGASPIPSDVFFSQTVDTNYQVGLTWARQAQIRAIYHANRSWTAAVSLENPQQYQNSVVVPSFYSNQVDNGSNPAAPNARPDVIAKLAWDHSGNHPMHVEAAGLWRAFRTVRPDGTHSQIEGGGGSVNAFLGLTDKLRLVVNTFVSSGGGRYIFGLGPDFIVRPDGSLSPVHSMSAIGGFECQLNPATQIYGYYGGAYFRSNYSMDASGHYVGFGFPGSPGAANRSVQEPTFGYVHTFWKNPNYGALMVNLQYSYVTRVPWSPAPGIPNAHSHMVFTDLRYVLP